MAKLVSVHTNSELVECPPKWDMYKGRSVECSIYESENSHPGMRWFYIFDDAGDSVSYFHCNLADTEYDDATGTVTFDTLSGSRYVIELGDEQLEGYRPYMVVGRGADAVIVGGTAFERELEELGMARTGVEH